MPLHNHLPAMLAGLLSGAAALAQTPVNPPPWWAVPDAVTLSAYWDFSGGPSSPPTFVVASPAWYSPLVTGATFSSNIVAIPVLGTHTGCVGLPGTGALQTGSFTMKVDNDPHLDWVKLFWIQFDAFEGSSGDIASEIDQDLANYGRAIVEVESEPIGGGWERVTISAELIPQPDDEDIDWTFTNNALSDIAIDNLFVSSKCVKPGPDQDGDALGSVVPGTFHDLTALTGAHCVSAAVTEGPAPQFLPTYFVGTRATVGLHQVIRIFQGAVIGQTPLPGPASQSPFGACALTQERVGFGPTAQQFVFALVDSRPVGQVVLHRLDAAGVIVGSTPLVAFPSIGQVPQQDFGLAFDPSGQLGVGSFWVSTAAGTAYEFNRAGTQILDQRTIPPGCAGLGYDHTLGNFYGFSRTPQPSPPGSLEVNGFEWSGYDFQTTGVRFCGDIRIPNPGFGPGGVATGLEAWRPSGTPTSRLRLICVVDVQGQGKQFLYEIAGPYGFGWSQLGRCGMAGVPFVGSTFQITLTGVPNALGALLFIGLSNQAYLGVPLPLPLASIGWPESYLSISPDLNAGFVLPTAPGSFAFPFPLPPVVGLSYLPLFFQWIVFDTQVPGFLAASQAGKTIAY
ncbi:MAG TPA: hypothetical protein VFD82_17575 [Planctomycetota bacterium]|nr:hypothetical protein [Planctomycetota bacterium]